MPLNMVSTKRIAIARYVWFIYVPNKTLQHIEILLVVQMGGDENYQ